MEQIQSEVKNLGESIFSKSSKGSGKSLFTKDYWYGRIMEWSMKNEQFKTQMFRFVDVLPYLNSGSEVARHLKEYFAEGDEKLPSIFNMGVGVGSLAPGLMAGAVRKNVTQMAKMFITGETPGEALAVIKKARKNNICFTVDLLGEATVSEKEALDYQKRYLDLVTWLAKDSLKWKDLPTLDTDDRGAIPKVNVSVKLTTLYSQIKVSAWRESIEELKNRLRPILKTAVENNVFINIDMEHYEVKDLTIEVFKEILLEEEFKNYPHFGIVIQAYLRDSYADLEKLIEYSRERGTSFSIRLVKGAYWDAETIHAEQNGWPYPVYTVKKESDANYERCLKLIFENYEFLRVAIGSHNIRSISSALVMAEKMGIAKNALEIQMLYGMADQFKKSLVDMGYRLREYAPVGELIPGMAYLVRRLLENTSNESFLRSNAENASTETLLADPNKDLQASPDIFEKKDLFYNEPILDFTLEKHRTSFEEALKNIRSEFGATYPLHINGLNVETGRTLDSINPSQKSEVIGKVSVAGTEHAEMAMHAASEAFKTWKKVPAEKRADYLDRLADKITEKRYELAALEVFEAGKAWSEADGDITETIDFLRYYARDMRRLSHPQKIGHIPGEANEYIYQAKGVIAVIAPWNFPLAILTGMVGASVVAGNTVVMKPAEQTSVIAAKLMQLLNEIELPPGVVNFLPGFGEEVGEFIVGHKDTAMIAFTGSREVGLKIFEKAAKVQPGQKQLKKCIIEMGGKNAIIVDSDADLDEAITGVLYSAFGFQGQKCSACSRVIVLEENYDRFIDRLLEAAKSILVTASENPKGYLGPVIDEEAYKKIMSMIEMGKSEATLAFQGEVPEGGFFVPPTIFTDAKSQHKIAQDEIFGPVLAVIKVKDINEAVDVLNDTMYGLTGGLYSRSPANIEFVRENVEVGNFYINRGCTGAMVDRHPFGGFKMSGIGSKTGGPDYLKQFLEPRAISENTMRRGFAPSDEVTSTEETNQTTH